MLAFGELLGMTNGTSTNMINMFILGNQVLPTYES